MNSRNRVELRLDGSPSKTKTRPKEQACFSGLSIMRLLSMLLYAWPSGKQPGSRVWTWTRLPIRRTLAPRSQTRWKRSKIMRKINTMSSRNKKRGYRGSRRHQISWIASNRKERSSLACSRPSRTSSRREMIELVSSMSANKAKSSLHLSMQSFSKSMTCSKRPIR